MEVDYIIFQYLKDLWMRRAVYRKGLIRVFVWNVRIETQRD